MSGAGGDPDRGLGSPGRGRDRDFAYPSVPSGGAGRTASSPGGPRRRFRAGRRAADAAGGPRPLPWHSPAPRYGLSDVCRGDSCRSGSRPVRNRVGSGGGVRATRCRIPHGRRASPDGCPPVAGPRSDGISHRGVAPVDGPAAAMVGRWPGIDRRTPPAPVAPR